MKKLLESIAALAVTFASAFLTVFTVWKLWQWHVVPLGAPQIGFGRAWGLSLIVTVPFTAVSSVLLWQQFSYAGDDKETLAWRVRFGVVGTTALSLLIGWLVR